MEFVVIPRFDKEFSERRCAYQALLWPGFSRHHATSDIMSLRTEVFRESGNGRGGLGVECVRKNTFWVDCIFPTAYSVPYERNQAALELEKGSG